MNYASNDGKFLECVVSENILNILYLYKVFDIFDVALRKFYINMTLPDMFAENVQTQNKNQNIYTHEIRNN